MLILHTELAEFNFLANPYLASPCLAVSIPLSLKVARACLWGLQSHLQTAVIDSCTGCIQVECQRKTDLVQLHNELDFKQSPPEAMHVIGATRQIF